MKTTLLHKLEILPEPLQDQVLEYVEFLLSRHHLTEDSGEFDLSDAEKVELDRRLAAHQSNPQEGSSLEEVTTRLLKKHGGI